MALSFSFSLTLLLASTASAADLAGDLTGLWTSIPTPASGAPKAKGMPGRHDALRVDGSAHAVVCEHGGYRNMSVLPCPWARAALTLGPNGSVVLATAAPGGITWSGSYQARNATACGWTLAPPGAYWTAASKYEPPFPVVDCSVITFPSNGETWVRLREVSKVHVVSMSHLDVGYTGSIAFTLNSYFAGIQERRERQSPVYIQQHTYVCIRTDPPSPTLRDAPSCTTVCTVMHRDADFFPTAIRVQQELDDAGRPETLHYITHPWLVYM